MPAALAESGFLDIAGQRLEYRFCGPQPADAPTILLLHEGLGCAGLWLEFPQTLAEVTGCGVFAWSRAGYGQSDPVPLPRPLSYMHDEACDVLPGLIDSIGLRKGLLIGHSDGASIAAIYAGMHDDPRIRGISVMAPHFIVEDISIHSIADAKQAYETTDLRKKLARWHANPDVAFYGWNGAWLDPEFRSWDLSEFLRDIRVPVQILQGEDDQYGTMRQVDVARACCRGPLEVTVLAGVKHTPWREAKEQTLSLLSDFARKTLAPETMAKPAAEAQFASGKER
ncbi:MAG: alpha/beta fold hydrolase [Beijerinckiaceae bacterium]